MWCPHQPGTGTVPTGATRRGLAVLLLTCMDLADLLFEADRLRHVTNLR